MVSYDVHPRGCKHNGARHSRLGFRNSNGSLPNSVTHSQCRYQAVAKITALFLLALVLPFAQTQALSSSILSATFYETCTDSPLSNAQCQSSRDLSGADGITVVRLRIVSNQVSGVENLVFQLDSTIGESQTSPGGYGTTVNCASSEAGGDCAAFGRRLVLSVSSSPLFAQYDLSRRQNRINYSLRNEYLYFDEIDDDDDAYGNTAREYRTYFPDNSGRYNQVGALYEPYPTCTNKEGGSVSFESQNTPIMSSEDTSSSSTCPDSLDDDIKERFYTTPVDINSSACPTLGCAVADTATTASNPHVSFAIRPKAQGPFCNVYDISPRARAALDISIDAAFVGSDDSDVLGTADPILLSTTNGATLAAGAPVAGSGNTIFAEIAGIDSTTGIVANYLDGLIVTCNTADSIVLGDTDASDPPSDGGIDNGISGVSTGDIDDLAAPPSTVATPSLFNPWRAYNLSLGQQQADKRCALPSAKCRASFGGTPSDAFWYYVPENKLIHYGGPTTCNANGATDQIYSDPINAQYMCAQIQLAETDANSGNTRDVPTIGAAANTCIPGSPQPNPGVANKLFNTDTVQTPCLISQDFASTLASIYRGETNPQVSNSVPEDYRVTSPQYMVQGSRLLREAISGTGDSVAVEVDLYVTGQLLGDITRVTVAEFVSEGMICDGTNGESGEVAYTVRNRGTTPGTTLVTAAFIFNDAISGNEDATLNVESSSSTDPVQINTDLLDDVSCAPECIFQQELQVGVGTLSDGQFTYQYTGELGTPLIIRLILSSPDGNNVYDSADLSCNIILGTTASEVTLIIPEVITFPDPPPCRFWDYWRSDCSADRGFFATLLWILLIGLVVLFILPSMVAAAIVFCVAVGKSTSLRVSEARAQKARKNL